MLTLNACKPLYKNGKSGQNTVREKHREYATGAIKPDKRFPAKNKECKNFHGSLEVNLKRNKRAVNQMNFEERPQIDND